MDFMLGRADHTKSYVLGGNFRKKKKIQILTNLSYNKTQNVKL